MHVDREPRIRVEFEVAVEERGRQVFSPVLNLSSSGMLLVAPELPPVGTAVRVVASLPPAGRFVRLYGTVVRHAPEEGPSAFAVAFRATDEQTRSELRSFVAMARA